MTIDEAIKHYEELAEVNDDIADNCDMDNWMNKADCEERASDYRQLAEWLRELQELRSLKSDYVIFRAEAKRLLMLAVENMNDGGCTRSCSTCKYGRDGCKYTEGYEWVHTEEAAKLFKEE